MADRTNFIITPELEARFWAKVDVRGPDECWPWLASTNGIGYGRFWADGKLLYSSHVALAIDGKKRCDGLMALHSCDNPPCCNPSHLRWGTHASNMRDLVARGKAPRLHPRPPRARRCKGMKRKSPWGALKGEANIKAKLSPADVGLMREAGAGGASATALASRYGLSISTVSKILLRKRWKHIP